MIGAVSKPICHHVPKPWAGWSSWG